MRAWRLPRAPTQTRGQPTGRPAHCATRRAHHLAPGLRLCRPLGSNAGWPRLISRSGRALSPCPLRDQDRPGKRTGKRESPPRFPGGFRRGRFPSVPGAPVHVCPGGSRFPGGLPSITHRNCKGPPSFPQDREVRQSQGFATRQRSKRRPEHRSSASSPGLCPGRCSGLSIRQLYGASLSCHGKDASGAHPHTAGHQRMPRQRVTTRVTSYESVATRSRNPATPCSGLAKPASAWLPGHGRLSRQGLAENQARP